MTITFQKKEFSSSDFLFCPDCDGKIIEIMHEQVCEDCGLVVSELKMYSSYQFTDVQNSDFSAGDQYVSIGKRVDNICSLGSHIGFYSEKCFFDYKNHIVNSNMQKKFHKLKKYYSLPLKIKNHETDYRILKILNDVSKFLHLTETIKKRAAYFYQTIKRREKKITNHVTLIAFCIFYASREYHYQTPLSIKNLCNIFMEMGHRINPKLIIRDSLLYRKYLNNAKNQPHSHTDYITRFINAVVNSAEVHNRMKIKKSSWTKEQYRILLTNSSSEIIDIIKKRRIGARNPYILASSIVYAADKWLAKKEKTKSILTQKTASNAMEVPEYSIRDHYVKVLKPILKL